MMDDSLEVHGVGVPAASKAANAVDGSRRLHVVLFVLFLGGTAMLLLRGFSFYRLGVGERVDHPDFRILGPGSNVGHAYGIAGTALILTNLSYLLRRRFARLSMGSLRAWLDIHVFTGLFGALLVLFHSAFQARSAVALVTVSSLLVVVVTGLAGRYLYALSPKPDHDRLERLLRSLDVVGPGLGAALARSVAGIVPTPPPERASLLATLVKIPSWAREMRARRRAVEQTVAAFSAVCEHELALVSKPIAECTRIFAAEVRSVAAASMLRSWRGLHRMSALLMLVLVAMHIGVAWYYGFVWVFSG